MLQRIRPYFKYLAAEKLTVFAAVFYGIVYAASSSFGLPAVVAYVFPLLFDKLHPLTPSETILTLSSIPLVFLLRAWSSYRNSYYVQLAGVRILERIRLDYFRKIQFLPLSFLQRQSSGDLISRGLSDTAQLQGTLSNLANDGIKQPFALVGGIAAVITIACTFDGAGILLLSTLVIPISVLPIRYVGGKIVKRAHRLQGQLGSVTNVFNENLAAAREVRAFGLEEHETKRLKGQTGELITAQMKLAKYALALTPSVELITAMGLAAAIYMAYGRIEITSFMAIGTGIYMAYEPVKKIAAMNNDLKRASASLERLEEVLNEPILIADPEKPVEISRLKGDVRFDHLSFAYKADEQVLREVDVSIPAGTACALVGPSGAGKTTFINLIPRFYEAGQGRVTVDGIDIRDLRVADLRRNIAIVSQDPVLFNDTIYNNLLLGRPEATREEVEQAARNAFAHDFILGLEGGLGYNTMVGERGGRLSGGQKQRIALARAFLRNAPILILDEATSALDTESEAFIQRALKNLMAGKTVFIIAHRFSTIRDASLILVFEKGRIIAQGSHEELYRKDALYTKLYDGQLSHGAAAEASKAGATTKNAQVTATASEVPS